MNGIEVPAARIKRQEDFNRAPSESAGPERVSDEKFGDVYVDVLGHVLERRQGDTNESYWYCTGLDDVSSLQGADANSGGRWSQVYRRRLWRYPVVDNIWKPPARWIQPVEISVEARKLVHIHRPNVEEEGPRGNNPPGIDEVHVSWVCIHRPPNVPPFSFGRISKTGGSR